MQKTNRKPKKSLQGRNPTPGNAASNGANIFELVSGIPKTSKTFLPFDDYKVNLQFATGLLEFCKLKFPDELTSLFFNENQEIDSLIFELSNIVLSGGIKITFEPNCIQDSISIDFISEQENYDWYWYVIEGKHYHQIESRELKTAFFKVLNRFSDSTEISFLNHTFENDQDSHFDEISDYMEMTREENIEYESASSDFDQDMHTETYQEFFLKSTEPIRDCLVEFNNHINLDLDNSIFKNYQPKNEFEEQLKNLLLEGLEEIDFSIIHKFADHINPYPSEDCYYEDEAFTFTSSYMVLYDTESTFEEELLINFNHRLENIEVTYPASYYRYQNKKLTKGTTSEDSEKLIKTCQFLCNLENLFVP